MKKTNGRLNGHYTFTRSTPDIAVLRACCSFSDRIEAFLESACQNVSVMSLPQLLEADRADQPLLVCLIGDTLDDNMWHALAEMRARYTIAPVLLFLRRSTVPEVTHAMRMGVFEILVEPIAHENVMRAINAALDQCAKTRPELLERQGVLDRLDTLTPRMRQVLELLQAGLSNREAADRLGLSPKTVERHRQQLKDKLRAKTFVEMIRIVASAQAGALGARDYSSLNGLPPSLNGLPPSMNGLPPSMNGSNGSHLTRSLLIPEPVRESSLPVADNQAVPRPFDRSIAGGATRDLG